LTLESYAECAAQQMRAKFTTRTMFDPVIGVPEWKHLAKVLIEGLNWLHEQGCVHGDIKPANILIQEETQEINENGSPVLLPKFRPLYCDFSSARILVTGKESPIPADLSNDAITPQYSAPEILAGYGCSDHSVIPSFASDVFSLATTLITAATGESPYAGAGGPQMLSMARAGKPLEAARAGSNATRVMKKRLVENVILKALEGKPEVRLTAQQWLREFEAVA
jgi:serine/threonine protein kinase